jgi:hypothetical protein
MRAFLLSFAALAAKVVGQSSDPSYDHQTVTYNSQFEPVSVTKGSVQLTPFFSPEHASDTLVGMIQSVKAGGRIDIAAPGFDSWSAYNCSYGPTGGCIGCTIDQMTQEPFPIFPAILNAIHQQGAVVRVVVRLACSCYIIISQPFVRPAKMPQLIHCRSTTMLNQHALA